MSFTGVLLDAHVPVAVITSVRAVRPDTQVEHLARWRHGALRQADDKEILRAVRAEGLVFVSYDLATIPALLHRWLAEGEVLPAVALIASRGGVPPEIGTVARFIVRVFDDPSLFPPDYPIVYLQPG